MGLVGVVVFRATLLMVRSPHRAPPQSPGAVDGASARCPHRHRQAVPRRAYLAEGQPTSTTMSERTNANMGNLT
jgi:hypothetical protein